MKIFYFALCNALILCVNWAYASEAGMPQLDPEFWSAQIFWLVIIFSTLYLIIWKIFLPRITQSIENRKSRIIDDIDEAQKLKENAEKKLDEYNKIIENAKKEAKKIIEDGRKKLENNIENKKKKFNEEIEKELLEAEKEIEHLRKSSVLNIKNIAAETSGEIMRQIINIEVNKSNVTAIVDDVTKKVVEKSI